MKRYKWMTLALGAALILTLAACSSGGQPEETASPTPDPAATPAQEGVEESPAETVEGESGEAATLTMSAAFQDEAGAALADTTIRFTVGDTEAEYLTGEDGTLTVASLPAEGTVEVAVLDTDGAETGAAVLEISQGSVTDVTDEGDGTVSVTLLSDIDQISLSFTQRGRHACLRSGSGRGELIKFANC